MLLMRYIRRCLAMLECRMNVTSNAIRSLSLEGPAGRLEALLNEGAGDAPYAALVCHPHPLYGGTLHNKVVFHTMKALNAFGFPVLRFNFRGAGLSEGEHDHGRGEQEDVRTALDWLENEFHLPIFFAGFSFGSAIGMQVACPDPRVKALIGLGLPVSPIDDRRYDLNFLHDCLKPRLFISGSRDQYAPRKELERLVESLPEPRQLKIIESADHFFEGRLREMREVLETWIKETVKGLTANP
jgi:alpha/beta superfamily hydrolase